MSVSPSFQSPSGRVQAAAACPFGLWLDAVPFLSLVALSGRPMPCPWGRACQLFGGAARLQVGQRFGLVPAYGRASGCLLSGLNGWAMCGQGVAHCTRAAVYPRTVPLPYGSVPRPFLTPRFWPFRVDGRSLSAPVTTCPNGGSDRGRCWRPVLAAPQVRPSGRDALPPLSLTA